MGAHLFGEGEGARNVGGFAVSDQPPSFTGIPCRGCFYTPAGCMIVEIMPKGAPVICQRQPDNPYDSNAIMVLNEDEIWFGYIGREYAAEIAPWMDQGWFFTAQKMDRVKCHTIIRLDPILPLKATAEETTEVPFDLSKTMEPVL
jgi:hypothetical protein